VDWKYWDVAIAVAGFLIQCGLALLGLTLTKGKHKAWFAALVLFGAVFTGFAVKRGIDSADKVQAQLNIIQSNTEKPQNPPIVNVTVPPFPSKPEHTHATFLEPMEVAGGRPIMPFTENEVVNLSAGYRNSGDYSLRNTLLGAVIKTAPIAQIDKSVFKDYEHEIKLNSQGGTVEPHTNTFDYHTYHSAPLTKEEVDNLNAVKSGLCVIGKVRWEDDTGKYQTNFCRCLVVEPTPPGFNWHSVRENNQEVKLK
jgi:hypothetical protein